jgi:iron complex outermembrane receptor protein
MTSYKNFTGISSLAIALAASSMAWAADPTDAPAKEGVTDGSEIVVTGLRRNEQYINAPVSVQVFDSKAIETAGITRPQDFLSLTPNVTFVTSNHAGEFFVNIRGQASIRQSESAVAVVIDGVQLATSNEFNGELFDIEQIEVLKGPQGAYYGRNAAAGAIIINTKAPTDDLEGEAKLSYGNNDTAKATASIGGAIVPGKLHFRVSGAISDTDGSYTNIITGEKMQRYSDKVGRLRLNWEASPDLKFDLRVNGTSGHGGAIGFNPQVAGTVVGGVTVTGIDTQNTSIPYVNDVPGLNKQKKFSTSLKMDANLGFATLTSVTAYNQITDDYQAKNFPYADFLDARNNFGIFAVVFGDKTQRVRVATKAFTQEIRLSSPDDKFFQWQVGAYYLKSRRHVEQEVGLNGKPVVNPDGSIQAPVSLDGDGNIVRTLQGGGVILPTHEIDGIDSVNPTVGYDNNKYNYENYAPFANVQIKPTENFEIRLAGRYDIEKRKVETITPDIPNAITGASSYNFCVLSLGVSADQCHDKATFKQFQPKATATYKFPGVGSVYASWGKSFKSGGFNPIGTRAQLLSVPGTDPSTVLLQDSYKKEVGTTYEVGFKTRLLDNKLSLNGAVFQTDVKNAQQFEFFPTVGIQAVSSIDKVRIKGFEIDMNWKVNDFLTVFGGYGYIDAKIRKLLTAPQFEGNRAPYSAKYNVNGGAQIVYPVTDNYDLKLRGEYTRTGSIWYDASNLPGSMRDPVDLVNARASIASENLEVGFYGRNLLDKKYNSEAIPLLAIVQATFKAPRRSYGMEVRYKF